MDKKIELINVGNPELAKIIAKMAFNQFGMPVWVSDTSGEPGWTLEIEKCYDYYEVEVKYFMMGVNAVLGRFFSL